MRLCLYSYIDICVYAYIAMYTYAYMRLCLYSCIAMQPCVSVGVGAYMLT
jgi:hypothetical protein